ncbi:hypothetical protein [Acinetobacter pittii]|uniref:hypothetical protein n=1 Tax=Acinetobacter pittii TaxID=48296 RepID=UPI002A08F997|nr:hypothetical protein [Acinetobacter pittii]MDX8255681.1 hypothetical protein [Acinetobacter pittii]
MAGRKPLTLTNLDYVAIVRHVNDLPFKRKCEAELLSIFDAEKHHISALTTNELAVLKKCRYERNAYMKRQTLLQLILATDPSRRTTLEQKVAILSNQKQIDAYFTMHDTLDLLLRKNRTATAEKNAVKKADMALNPEVKNDSKKDERKQRDSENYFLGAYIKKLLASSDFYKHENEIQRIARLFSTVEPDKKSQQLEIYREAKNDPRNPFD